MGEATNELAFLVTGYGKPVPKQDGAPLRLARRGNTASNRPSRSWGSFTDKRPVSFWETCRPRIWPLGECQSGGAAPTLEPGE